MPRLPQENRKRTVRTRDWHGAIRNDAIQTQALPVEEFVIRGGVMSTQEKAAQPQTHTPGPWEMSGTTVYGSLGSNPDICEAFNEDEHTVRGISKAEAEANARLIASAPDLLTELEHELEELSGWMRDREISDDTKLAMRIRYVKIQEVIAKARGAKP
jgi:hypothetical protein